MDKILAVLNRLNFYYEPGALEWLDKTNPGLKREEEDLFGKMIDNPTGYYKKYRNFIEKYSLEYRRIKNGGNKNDNYRSLG